MSFFVVHGKCSEVCFDLPGALQAAYAICCI